MAASVGMTGRVGRESSVCAGANSSPPHSAMRLLFEVCQEVGFCPRVYTRDSVARTPTVTISSAIATKMTSATAVAMQLPRRAAHRALLSKLSTPVGFCQRTSPGPILHQLPVNRKDNCKGYSPGAAGDGNPPVIVKPNVGVGLPGKKARLSRVATFPPREGYNTSEGARRG